MCQVLTLVYDCDHREHICVRCDVAPPHDRHGYPQDCGRPKKRVESRDYLCFACKGWRSDGKGVRKDSLLDSTSPVVIDDSSDEFDTAPLARPREQLEDRAGSTSSSSSFIKPKLPSKLREPLISSAPKAASRGTPGPLSSSELNSPRQVSQPFNLTKPTKVTKPTNLSISTRGIARYGPPKPLRHKAIFPPKETYTREVAWPRSATYTTPTGIYKASSPMQNFRPDLSVKPMSLEDSLSTEMKPPNLKIETKPLLLAKQSTSTCGMARVVKSSPKPQQKIFKTAKPSPHDKRESMSPAPRLCPSPEPMEEDRNPSIKDTPMLDASPLEEKVNEDVESNPQPQRRRSRISPIKPQSLFMPRHVSHPGLPLKEPPQPPRKGTQAEWDAMVSSGRFLGFQNLPPPTLSKPRVMFGLGGGPPPPPIYIRKVSVSGKKQTTDGASRSSTTDTMTASSLASIERYKQREALAAAQKEAEEKARAQKSLAAIYKALGSSSSESESGFEPESAAKTEERYQLQKAKNRFE